MNISRTEKTNDNSGDPTRPTKATRSIGSRQMKLGAKELTTYSPDEHNQNREDK